MNTTFGLATATVVLQQVLETGFAALNLSDALGRSSVTISCLAPYEIAVQPVTNQLNIFLYQQSSDKLFNGQPPVRAGRTQNAESARLALDLHFLLTAYGTAPLYAEVLLDAALQILRDTPVVGRDGIREMVSSSTLGTIVPVLAEAGVAEGDIEQIHITPLDLSLDELSRVWLAIQVPLRLCAVYQLSLR